MTADIIENFPGFPCGTRGEELADSMLKQAEAFGLIISTREVKNISVKKKETDPFIIETAERDNINALSIIIATGAGWDSLNVPGEDKLKGRGVSYCATCDGPLFKGREVIVVGGGDTALSDAIYLTRFASKVTIVHRRGALRATRILQERAFADKKIKFCLKSVVTEISGNNKVDGVKVRNTETSEDRSIKADGVFVLIGQSPNSGNFKDILKLDEKGYIIEGAIRWDFLGVMPEPGKEIRLSPAVHEIDRKGGDGKLVWFFRNEEKPQRFVLGKIILTQEKEIRNADTSKR